MLELIDRLETIQRIENAFCSECDCERGDASCRVCEYDFCIGVLNEMPTIKPEMRHGEWHECWYTDTVCASICTCCGKATTQARHIVGQELMTNVRYPLCPNCGADMRKESADNG